MWYGKVKNIGVNGKMDLCVLTTGGTSDKACFDALGDSIGDPQIKDILERGRVSLEYCLREVVRRDSLDMVQDDRLALWSCIKGAPHTRSSSFMGLIRWSRPHSSFYHALRERPLS